MGLCVKLYNVISVVMCFYMGTSVSTSRTTLENIIEALQALRVEMSLFQSRLAGLERDVSKCGVKIKENSNALLNISLLEEGRSVYKKPKRHTASTFK